jgi:hypothetical protein
MDVLQYVFTLILTIVSASAGLLGALIGYRSAQRTTQANIDLAREQRRFDRAQEMRAEVIPRLFVLLGRLEEHTAWALDLPGRGTEWIRPIMKEYVEGRLNQEQAAAQEEEALEPVRREFDAQESQMKELKEYFLLHRIWLPEHLVSAFEGVMDGYDAHMPMAATAVAQWAARGQSFFETDPENAQVLDAFLNQEKAAYEAGVRETRNWFEGDRLTREAAMWSAARKVLAVEE